MPMKRETREALWRFAAIALLAVATLYIDYLFMPNGAR